MRLPVDKAVERGFADKVSHLTVQRILKTTTSASSPEKVPVQSADGKRRLWGLHGRRSGRLLPSL